MTRRSAPGNAALSARAEAERLHKGQLRKGSNVPYFTHLESVAALVQQHGGTEAVIAAAYLHDGPEDQGGTKVLAEIEERLGPEVAEIVRHCSDTLVEDRREKEEWWTRKRSYHQRLRSAPQSTVLVSLADKVDNIEETVRGHRESGVAVFDRFTTGREGTLWNYRELLAIYRERAEARCLPLLERLERALREVESRAAGAPDSESGEGSSP
jgi:(p)ppGpp synthase/HD superfamily hydrolase